MENWAGSCKRMKLNYLTLYTKINSKWIEDLYVRLETKKFLKWNIVSSLPLVGLGDDFLNLKPKARATKPKINTWDYIKLKYFCIANENNKNERATYRMGENICNLMLRYIPSTLLRAFIKNGCWILTYCFYMNALESPLSSLFIGNFHLEYNYHLLVSKSYLFH